MAALVIHIFYTIVLTAQVAYYLPVNELTMQTGLHVEVKSIVNGLGKEATGNAHILQCEGSENCWENMVVL